MIRYVNIGLGNGLVPSGKKPSAELLSFPAEHKQCKSVYMSNKINRRVNIDDVKWFCWWSNEYLWAHQAGKH